MKEETVNRKEFFDRLPKWYTPDDLRLVQHAYWLAKEGHRKQKRDTGERYFEHVRAVALLCIELGFDDPETVATALLHDGREDTFTPPSVYIVLLGRDVWHAISALSKSLPMFDDVYGNVICYHKKEIAAYFKGIADLAVKFRVVKGADRLHNHRTQDGMKPERLARNLAETREWVLPLMEATEPKLAQLILQEVLRHEARLSVLSGA